MKTIVRYCSVCGEEVRVVPAMHPNDIHDVYCEKHAPSTESESKVTS